MTTLRRIARALLPSASRGPDRAFFEDWHRRGEDPWGHLASDYERERFDWTLAALGDRRFGRALEVGCSIGVFTERLAAHCEELLAVDISQEAVDRARERLADLPNVTIDRRTLPEDMPPGAFDLVVCADVLVYWTAEELRSALGPLEAAVGEGGVLLAVSYRPKVRVQPLRGDQAHDLLTAHTALTHTLREDRGDHRLDRFERRHA